MHGYRYSRPIAGRVGAISHEPVTWPADVPTEEVARQGVARASVRDALAETTRICSESGRNLGNLGNAMPSGEAHAGLFAIERRALSAKLECATPPNRTDAR